MLAKWHYLLAALCFGALIPLQGVINSRLAKVIHVPLHASLISFVVGFLSIFAINLLLRTGVPTFSEIRAISPILLSGGILGAIFVTAFIYIIPQIGAATHIAMTVTGQLIFAVVIDHFGLFSMPSQAFTWQRLVGCLFLILGVLLIQKF